VLGPYSYHASRCIQLNRYYYKSRDDFAEKMARGLVTPSKDVAREKFMEAVPIEFIFTFSQSPLIKNTA
jgi:hypothetical protein